MKKLLIASAIMSATCFASATEVTLYSTATSASMLIEINGNEIEYKGSSDLFDGRSIDRLKRSFSGNGVVITNDNEFYTPNIDYNINEDGNLVDVATVSSAYYALTADGEFRIRHRNVFSGGLTEWLTETHFNQFAADHGISYTAVYNTQYVIIAITNDGRVVTSGNDNNIALCNDTPYGGRPAFVSTITATVEQVETHSNGWIARDVNGEAWGCGSNGQFQIGDAQGQYATGPAVKFDIPGFVTDVSATSSSYAASTSNGSVYMSGYVYDAEIWSGYGNTKLVGMQDVTYKFNNETVLGVSGSNSTYVITDSNIYTDKLGVYIKDDKLALHGIDDSVDPSLYIETFYPFYKFPEPEPEPEETTDENSEDCNKKGKGHKKHTHKHKHKKDCDHKHKKQHDSGKHCNDKNKGKHNHEHKHKKDCDKKHKKHNKKGTHCNKNGKKDGRP